MMGFSSYLMRIMPYNLSEKWKRLICPGLMTITWLPLSGFVRFAERYEMFGKKDLHSLKVTEVQ